MMYGPKMDNWTSMDPMPIRRNGFAADSLNGEIYLFGVQMTQVVPVLMLKDMILLLLINGQLNLLCKWIDLV